MKTTVFIYCCSLFFILSVFSACDNASSKRSNDIEQDSIFYKTAKSLFDQGVSFQEQEKFLEAIPIYQKLISLSPSQCDLLSWQRESVALIMDEGFLQLVYCFIYSQKRQDGIEFFQKIYKDKQLWFIKNYPRSVEIYMAYGLYEATQVNLAMQFLSKGMNRPEQGRTQEQIYVDNGIASAIYNQVGDLDNAILCGERCVEIIRTMDNKSDIIFPLGNLISQYQQRGEFEKALQAYDELLASGEGEKNPYAMCYAEDNIVQLFTEWGMEEEVRLHLQKELDAAKACALDETLPSIIHFSFYGSNLF